MLIESYTEIGDLEMGRIIALLLGLSLAHFGSPVNAASAPERAKVDQELIKRNDAQRRNGLEMIPDALIGAWKADISASKFGGTAPKAQLRIFDYTHDGMLLVKVLSLSADGKQNGVNWEVHLDGSEGIEYMRTYGGTPYGIVTLKKISETKLDLGAIRYGMLVETGAFELSGDGKTLTFSYDADGRKSVVVYRKWDMLELTGAATDDRND